MDDGVNDKPDNVVILILNLFLPKTDELKWGSRLVSAYVLASYCDLHI